MFARFFRSRMSISILFLLTMLFIGILISGCTNTTESDDEWLIGLVMNEDQTKFQFRGFDMDTPRQEVLDKLDAEGFAYEPSLSWPPKPNDEPNETKSIKLTEPVALGYQDITAEVHFIFIDDQFRGGEYRIMMPQSEQERFAALFDDAVAQLQLLMNRNDRIVGSEVFEDDWELYDETKTKVFFYVPWDAEYYTEDNVLLILVGRPAYLYSTARR